MNVKRLDPEGGALQVLERLLGPLKIVPPAGGGNGFDFTLQLKGVPTTLAVEVKAAPRMAREQLEHVILRCRFARHQVGRPVLLFAPWIRDDQGARLREAGIFYADRQGNAWIDLEKPRILIDIRGRQPLGRPKADAGRLIEPTGLQVIHGLMTQPQLLKATYRRIAEQAGVGLTTVAVVIRNLLHEGYLVRTGRRERRLDRWNDLIEHFVRGYALKLRPALELARFRVPDLNPDQLLTQVAERLKAANAPAPWGVTGGYGGKLLTGHFEPDRLTILMPDAAVDVLQGLRLLPDRKEGNLTILKWFAPTVVGPDRKGRFPVATPLLVYAELLAEGGARELETAGIVRERFLKEPKA